jgi:hypothetical protein
MDIQERRTYFAMGIQEDKMIDLKREYFLVYSTKMQTYLIMKIAHFKCKNLKNLQLELLCGKNSE